MASWTAHSAAARRRSARTDTRMWFPICLSGTREPCTCIPADSLGTSQRMSGIAIDAVSRSMNPARSFPTASLSATRPPPIDRSSYSEGSGFWRARTSRARSSRDSWPNMHQRIHGVVSKDPFRGFRRRLFTRLRLKLLRVNTECYRRSMNAGLLATTLCRWDGSRLVARNVRPGASIHVTGSRNPG